MKEDTNNNHVCILRTGRMFEHDMAANALRENNIPFHGQMETSGGLRLAMPFQPASAPGTYYDILVPAQFAAEAKEILADLPVDATTEPEIWHFGASERAKRGWKICVWFILALCLAGFIANVILR